MMSEDSAPPATITVAMRIPRMYPTPRRGAFTRAAMLALKGRATEKVPFTKLKPWTRSWNSIPAPIPQNTPWACRPPPSAATSTSAHAIPSG